MRTVVSLVETRPETVGEDYRRVLALAGLPTAVGESPWLLLARSPGNGPLPGFASPPWQLTGVLDSLPEGARARVFPVGGRGPATEASAPGETGWGELLKRRGVLLVPPAERELKPVRVEVPLPALGAVLPDGFQTPPALAAAAAILLPVPALDGPWQLSGGVALLADLLAGRARKNRAIPRSEVVAEALGLARQVMGPMASVMDATVWGVFGRDGKAHPLARHILLAGQDPVAVDAVAARLAGLEPRRIPWLQLCADRGLGVVDADKIVIKGRKDLLDLDFQFPKGTFAHGSGVLTALARPGRILGALGRGKAGREFAQSAWGRLLAEYRTGAAR